MYRNETCARYTTICMTSVGGTDATFLAPALAAIVGADARPRALLALGPAAVMLAHLRSPAFLARAPDALVGADARPQALLARAPAAVMLAYLRPAAFLALALDAPVGAYARPQALLALAPFAVMLAYARSAAFLALAPLAVMLAFARRHSCGKVFKEVGCPWFADPCHTRRSLHSSVKASLQVACALGACLYSLDCEERVGWAKTIEGRNGGRGDVAAPVGCKSLSFVYYSSSCNPLIRHKFFELVCAWPKENKRAE